MNEKNTRDGSKKSHLPDNRTFGGFFAAIFLLLSGWLAIKQHYISAALSLTVFISLLVFTLLAPKLLTPANSIWFSLGLLLGKIISPIVLGLMFFILITPVSLVTRLFGRDELKMKKRSVESYWTDRSPPGPSSDSFKNQY
jgi:hypothetical protein